MRVFLLVLVVAIGRGNAASVEYVFGDDHPRGDYGNETVRDGKVFPFVAVVRLPDEACGSDTMKQGICRTKKQCQNSGGTVIDGVTCGGGYGVCCQFSVTCPSNGNGVTVTTSGTHITNSGSSSNAATPINCKITFRRPSSDICQVRLDFVNFELAGPDSEGNCNTDMMTISGADNLNTFVACGNNDGQHLYLHYGSAETISASISLGNTGSSYDIMATYLRCCAKNVCGSSTSSSSSTKNKNKGGLFSKGSSSSSSSSSNNNQNSFVIEPAPPGCTQYFTGSTGEVKSWNYMAPASADTAVQNQINNEKYMVCVECNCGSNTITWSPCTTDPATSFCISSLPGSGLKTGAECMQDYVEIPASEYGRYCGCGAFPTSVTSQAHPCFMWVNMDGSEEPPVPQVIDPTTGCPLGWTCVDPYGIPATTPPLCDTPEGSAMGYFCLAPDFYGDLLDDANTGFCMKA